MIIIALKAAYDMCAQAVHKVYDIPCMAAQVVKVNGSTNTPFNGFVYADDHQRQTEAKVQAAVRAAMAGDD